ncbi:MAG: hypothetical protein IK106_05485 [Clostridiales bacterium]|nr:hypothetical protein [Clostridiales bacterium]
MSDMKIIPLPKDQWKGTPILMRYTAEEYDFPDGLYADCLPAREAWIISASTRNWDM